MNIKKGLKLLILIVLVIGYKNVFATEQTFTHNDISYTIKKVHFDIYKSKLSSDNTFTGYEKTLVDTIELPDTYTITATYTDKDKTNEDEDEEYKEKLETHFVLKLDITKDQVKELIDSKITTVDANNHYYIRVVADYQINSIPSKYNKIYRIEFDGSSNAIIFNSDNEEENTIGYEESSLNTDYSLIFNAFEYKLVNGASTINYESTYTNESYPYMELYLNGIELTSYEYLTNTTDQDLYRQDIVMTGYDNYDTYVEALSTLWTKALIDNATNSLTKVTTPTGGQTINVPDTLEKDPKYIAIFGSVILCIGGILIGYTLTNKEKTN